MFMYLSAIDNPLVYQSYGDYVQSPPYTAPTGFQWVEGNLPENAVAYMEASLIQQLSNMFSELPIELKAKFAPLKAAIKQEIQEQNYDVAREIINQTEVDEEHLLLKQMLIAKIDEAMN